MGLTFIDSIIGSLYIHVLSSHRDKYNSMVLLYNYMNELQFVMRNYILNYNYNELQFVMESIAIEVQDMDWIP